MPRAWRVPRDTRVDRAGAPRYFRGGSTGVLLIHGWTGNVHEMTYLASKLAEAGFTVSVPRLPGHGTNGFDFMQAGWSDWLRKAIDAYLELARDTETVYVAGLSMGGVLTTILASMFDIDRIALFAPAVTNRNRLIVLTPLLRFFMKRIPKSYDDEEVEPILRPLAREYWHSEWVLPAYHLYRLQGLARRRLGQVTASTLVVVSESDESVPPRAADIIERKSSAKEVKRIDLTDSDHVLVNGVDKELVAAETVSWFERG